MIGNRLARILFFGRYLKARQILRRLYLRALEQIDPIFCSAPAEPLITLKRAPRPPLSILPFRSGVIERTKDCWRFTFLSRIYALPFDFAWIPSGWSQLALMNLHYMEYLAEVEDEDFSALVASWITENRPYRRGYRYAAWNSYTISLRTVVWMQQLAKRESSFPDEFLALASASLTEQLLFLEKRLETDIGGNHLIKNIKALLWGSMFFSGATAERWKHTALGLLDDVLNEQILADGVHFERSPSYHNQVFADLLECRHILRAETFPELDQALERMAQASRDLSHPDRKVCLFNDAGLSMSYEPPALLDAYLTLGGALQSSPEVAAYKDAGYFIIRFPELYLAVDCGQVGPDHLPAHAHGDILSFECSVFGKRLIVDQGVFEYLPGRRRDFARSTKAHNTVSIADEEQCDFFSSFRCGRRAKAELLSFERNEAITLSGTHNGFSHLPGRPQHFRTFSIEQRRFTIHDRIDGSQEAVARFLINPDWEIIDKNGGVLLLHNDHRVILQSRAPITIAEAEWWPDMGVSLPARRLVIPFSRNNTVSVQLC